MLFTSPVFLFAFLPAVYVGYLALERFGRWRLVPVWLIGASMVFYAWWSPWFLLLLIASMTANYFVGRLVDRARGGLRTWTAGAAIAGNLALLGYFKYANFFLANAAEAGLIAPWFVEVVLPLGVSFFTFQKIAWIADIHKGAARPADFVSFALFVFFFPQLIAGPIVHHAEVMPQYRRLARVGAGSDEMLENAAVGFTFILIGLFKKVVIADQIARYVSPVYAGAAGGVGLIAGWQAALGYTVQLYFDFSGYCDMAVGLARLFGVTFPANFNSPYRATSIIDFWRRWHMTLSRFLRDYVYIPLGGNRHGPARRYLNLFATMLIGGLWHGAGWTFIFWGALHGFYLLVNHAFRAAGARLPAPLGWAATLLAVAFAWVFFRAPDMASAFAVVKGMAGLNGVWTPGAAIEAPGALVVALALLLLCPLLPNSQQLLRLYHPTLDGLDPLARAQLALQWRPRPVWAILLGLSATAALLLSWDNSEFLYFNF